MDFGSRPGGKVGLEGSDAAGCEPVDWEVVGTEEDETGFESDAGVCWEKTLAAAEQRTTAWYRNEACRGTNKLRDCIEHSE